MFHVFVEGAKDASPAGLQKLADAIAARYGLKAADLLARLQAGRFRVKVNTDRTTADNYQRELDKLGARCTIEAATAQNSRPTPLPFAAAKPPEAAPSRPSLPPGALPPRSSTPPSGLPARPSSPPGALPARGAATTTPPAGQFSSGLAAAFSAGAPKEDLGAFAKLDAGALSLASVDGQEDAPDSAFAPPPDLETSPAPPVKPSAAKPAAAGAAAKPAKPAPPAKPKDEPLDLFVPSDPGADDFKVELAQDDADELAAKKAPPPAASAPAAAPPAAPRVSSPELRRSQPLPPVDAAVAPARRANPLGDARVRFIAGVLLALGLGFVPAHFIAKAREKSAYAEIDRKVETAQREAGTPEAYAALDARRAEWLEQKYSDRRNIAVMAVLIWGAVGAGIAFLWFKKVPWDRLSA